MAIIFQLFSFSAAKPSAPRWVSAEAGDAQGLQIIARSSMNLGYSATDPSAPPVMLHAKVGWDGCGMVRWDGQEMAKFFMNIKQKNWILVVFMMVFGVVLVCFLRYLMI